MCLGEHRTQWYRGVGKRQEGGQEKKTGAGHAGSSRYAKGQAESRLQGDRTHQTDPESTKSRRQELRVYRVVHRLRVVHGVDAVSHMMHLDALSYCIRGSGEHLLTQVTTTSIDLTLPQTQNTLSIISNPYPNHRQGCTRTHAAAAHSWQLAPTTSTASQVGGRIILTGCVADDTGHLETLNAIIQHIT